MASIDANHLEQENISHRTKEGSSLQNRERIKLSQTNHFTASIQRAVQKSHTGVMPRFWPEIV
jgi:hypothetical protein